MTSDEPEIVRHRTPSARPCTVAEAVAELDDLGLDFHLFVEATLGVDAVVHRDGVTGVRLALADGRADLVEATTTVAAGSVPAPVLRVPEAVEHLRLTGLTFLFFVDAEHGRGCLRLSDPASWTCSCRTRPSAVNRFSSHCCSIWISAHCRSQNAICWSPESGSRSSSEYIGLRQRGGTKRRAGGRFPTAS